MVVEKNRDPGLGAFLEQFRLSGFSGYILMEALLGFIFLLLGISNIALGTLITFSFIVMLVGMLLLAYTIERYVGKRYITFYEQGVVIEKNGIRQSAQYTEINIWQSISRMFIYAIPSGTTYFYTIEFPDGKRAVTTKRQIGERLQSMIVQYQLPQVIDAYNRGEDVKFKPIYINREGIKISLNRLFWPNLNKSFAWSDISNITVSNGFISIKKTGNRFNAVQIPVQFIPNVYVMFKLLQEMGYLHS